MSESKYSPEVNIPEMVPDRPESLTVLFLRGGQYYAIGGHQLVLAQTSPDKIQLGTWEGKDKFQPFLEFPGRLVVEEKKVVIG